MFALVLPPWLNKNVIITYILFVFLYSRKSNCDLIHRREGVADSALWAELGIKLDDAGEKVKVAQDKQN